MAAVHPWYFRPNEERVAHLTSIAVAGLRRWGVDGVVPELFLEGENAVFRADLPGYGPCAVRVHRAGYHAPEHLHWQAEWCRALVRDGAVRTARIFDTLDGASYVVEHHPEVPEPRFVSVLSWEPGASLKDGDVGPSTFETLGEIIGRVQVHGRTWSERDRFVGMRWDAEAFVGDEPVLGAFWDTPLLDDAAKATMVTFRDEARRRLAEHGYGPERFGIVHGDLLQQNLLEHEGEITVLDFDDCGHGWFAMEIATALMGASFRPDYAECRDALLTGYRRHLEPDPADLDLLPMLVALRRASFVGWVMTHPFTPAAIERGELITRSGVRAVERYLADAAR